MIPTRQDQVPVFMDRQNCRENVVLNYWRVYGTPEQLITNFAIVRGLQAARSYVQKHYPEAIKAENLQLINNALRNNILAIREHMGRPHIAGGSERKELYDTKE